MAAHVEADDDELIRRPFPEVNVAPATEPRPEPEPSAAAPPHVTSVEQVVPAPTLRLIRGWTRQLRRCLQIAARGDAKRAARMRPDDLWLPMEGHTVAGMGGWDWDFRPLREGRPAVPLRISGRDGVAPATGLALDRLEALADGFCDRAIVSEMMQGVRDDSACRRGTLLCAPHAGALANFQVATEKIAASEAAGWATCGFDLPCWPLRTCPYSVVDESERAGEPKFRLTTDLSWPHEGRMCDDGGPVDSVNDGMDRSAWPANRLLRVQQFAEAVAMFQGARRQRRARVWSMDGEAFYRVVGRQSGELWRNGIWTERGVHLDERCCFGDASAAVKCSRMSNLVVHCIRRALAAVDAEFPTRDEGWLRWQEARRAQAFLVGADPEAWAALHWVGMYVDDATAVGADDLLFDVHGTPLVEDGVHLRRQTLHFRAARDAFASLGWRSKPSKEQPPRERIEVLGVIVDMRGRRVWLADAKRQRYAARAREAAEQRHLTVADLRALVGRLQFAAQCYPVGRQYLHAAHRVMRADFRLTGERVRVSRALARDLLWWAEQLEREDHDGVPLAHCSTGVHVTDGDVIYADASGEGGFAAWTLRSGEVWMVAGDWDEGERGMLICELELLASTFGLVAFGSSSGRWVHSFTDNTVAEGSMRKLRARSPAMQAILRRRTRWMMARGLLETVQRITSKANVWADVGSRPELGGAAAVKAAARAAGYGFRLMQLPDGWRDTSTLRCPEPTWPDE